MQSPSPARRRRSLRHTVALWLGVGFLLLTGLEYHVIGSILTTQLLNEESRAGFARVRNLHHILAVAAEELSATAADWSQWDDTYAFAAGNAPRYVADNLPLDTFERLQLSFILIADRHGRAAFAQARDESGEALVPLAADIVRLAEADGMLGGGERPQEILTGLIASAAGIYLVSSHPVLDSAGTGPARGRLIMGRSMAATLVPTMERVTQLPVELLPSTAMPAGAPVGQSVLSNDFGDELHLRSGTALAYTALRDLWDRPVARLQIELERPVEAMLVAARPYLIAATLLIALIFYGVALFVLEYKVIDPMEKLATSVGDIGGGSAALARVAEPNEATEFGTLATAINRMLDQIEEQQSLARDRDAAIEANRLKSEFLATMSHEIRTPMNGVLGMCELLQRTGLDDRQRHLAETLLRSARSLLDVLNDILDFSKIESGKLQLEAAPFSPAELIHNTAAPFAAEAHSKSVELSVEVQPDVPPWMLGDALRLRQVLTNLLSNAVKFTHSGTVSVTCSVAAAPGPSFARVDEHRVELELAVTDTGIGITESAQRRIFEPFAQAEPGTAHRYGGTGLGLAIVKRLVGLMNGRIRLESEPGRGTRFSIVIALQRVPVNRLLLPQTAQPASAARAPHLPSPVVLLAEDNAVNREVLTEMLEHIGCRVTAVENGAEAVSAVAANKFDAVLLDCQMPVMDGHAAAAELRALERAAGQQPTFIVALTADATVENRERCFTSGMDAVVTKPVSHASLGELIRGRFAATGDSAA